MHQKVQAILDQIRQLEEQYQRGLHSKEFAELKSIRCKMKEAREKLVQYQQAGYQNDAGKSNGSLQFPKDTRM
jgi:hypothetical protein